MHPLSKDCSNFNYVWQQRRGRQSPLLLASNIDQDFIEQVKLMLEMFGT